MKKGKFGIGLVVGALAGAVTGLLTAPKSGKETRDELKKKALEKKDVLGVKMTETKKTAVNKADEVRHKAEDVKTRTVRAVESAKTAFKEEAPSGRK